MPDEKTAQNWSPGQELHIVFNHLPGGPDNEAEFIETETPDGRGVGQPCRWIERDGLARLVIPGIPALAGVADPGKDLQGVREECEIVELSARSGIAISKVGATLSDLRQNLSGIQVSMGRVLKLLGGK